MTTVAVAKKLLIPHKAELFVERKSIGFVYDEDSAMNFFMRSSSGKFEEIDIAGFRDEMRIRINESGQLFGVVQDTTLFIENECIWRRGMVSTSRFYVLNDDGTQLELLDVFGCAWQLFGSNFQLVFWSNIIVVPISLLCILNLEMESNSRISKYQSGKCT